MFPLQLPIMVVCLLLFTISSFAQVQVTGTVTDQSGRGVQGVTVSIKGTNTATQTDANGYFRLSAPANATLVFSSVGYASTQVDVGGRSSVNVSLTPTNDRLSEVVVIGYGTRRVKDATGSVAALTPKDFNKGVIATPEELMQGRTPGVIVTPPSGEPGAAASINIRGSASIRGNQEPLYVVDGVPMSPGGTSGTLSGVESSSTPKNPLMFLNPNDIESISILKDASSAAIYGSRGANGVILITTKSGRSGRGNFTFNASTSISNTASRYDLLSGPDFIQAVKKANIDAGTSPADAEAAVQLINKGFNTDWQDQIFRTGVSQTYNLGWGITKANTLLRISGSYDDIAGIIKNSGLKRMTARTNFTQKFLNNKLKFDVMATYSNVKNEYPPLTNGAGYQGSLMGAAISFNPTYPVYNTDGSFYDPKDGNRNPVEMLNYFEDKDKINHYLTNLSGTWNILEGLAYKATFGYDNSQSVRTSFADPRLSSAAFGGTNNVFGKDLGNPIEGNGRTTRQNLDLKTLLVEHTLTYDKALMNNSAINAVVGYSYQTTEKQYDGKIGWGLTTAVTKPTDNFVKDFDNFKNYYDVIPDFTKYDLQSYFGRINYSIADKYFLTGTMRIDGSSKFGENNKYGYFPAFAAKWRLSRESFAQGLSDVFSDLSIRANYGILGSQEGIGAYDAVNLQQTWVGNSGQKETVLLHQGNPDLKWEQAATTGAGLDFATTNNRLTGTIDYYYTKRKDLLFYAPTPGGFSAQSYWWVNLPGYVINRGMEFGLNLRAIKNDVFSWDVNYNMTFIHNEVKDFNVTVNTGGVNGQGLSGAYAQTFANGYPLFTWKMPTFNGFDANGNAIYSNGGKDELQGSALPKFLAGLTNSFNYKRWNASVFINTVRGFYVYNNTANALFLRGSVKTAHNITYDAASSGENPINPGSVSTRFLEKGDFVRLSNASIGYTFNMPAGKAIKSLSLSVTGQNLALWTDYSGLDPEVNVDHSLNGVPSRGFDYTGYPRPRTFTFGLNLGF
jgi:iron complex outermembrane receptor protein